MDTKIMVIGGGAAGITSAIAAAETSKNNKVTILERKDRVGKKILSTGNGKCNLSNINISKGNYYGNDIDFVENILNKYTYKDIIKFFESIGVMCRVEEGRIYPYSNNASSVLTCLRNKLKALNVEEITNFDVQTIKYHKGSYKVVSSNGEFITASKIIITTGGCASEHLGSNGSGFEILKKLGHNCTKLTPALVQLKTDQDLKSVKGVKFEGLARVIHDDKVLAEEYGEILFTNYGLSGICIMELSKFTRDYNSLNIELDFFPKYTKSEIKNILLSRIKKLNDIEMSDFFVGMLNKNLGQVVLKKSGIKNMSLKASSLTNKQIKVIINNLKNFRLKIISTNGFNNAQVTAGGILTKEFYRNTLESKLNKNIYAAGEVLDVFGDCGGYNLHFAWATGLMAGYNCGLQRSVS